MEKKGGKGKNNIIGFRRIRSVTSTKMCEMKICLLAPTQNLLLLSCSESSCAQRWFVLRLKKKKNLRKQFGNCAVSLKLPGSLCISWMKRALIQKKRGSKSSKHSQDALQSKEKYLDYKDNSSPQWRVLMRHNPRTQPSRIIMMDLSTNLYAGIVRGQIIFYI